MPRTVSPVYTAAPQNKLRRRTKKNKNCGAAVDCWASLNYGAIRALLCDPVKKQGIPHSLKVNIYFWRL